MATASRFNRGYSGGLAAGSQPGGGFKSNLPPMGFGTPAPMPGMKPPKTPQELALEEMNQPLDLSFQPPAAAQAPPPAAPDMNNFFGPAPLPGAGQQSFSQPPASPFGSAPLPEFGGFRARGGPVLPGRAYMVGERGPEMIVPQTPGMVIPNGAAPSPMNRGYAPGSLAGRGPTPVGRGIDDPARQSERLNRIARQQFGQTGDPSLMLSMNWRNRMGPSPAPTPAFTPPLPMAPAAAAPTGRLVPGISAGSMVWQPDAPDLPVPMMSEEAPPSFGPAPTAPTAPRPMESGAPGGFMPPPLAPARMPGGGLDVTQPLPPSTLGGGSGVPGPPAIEFRALPGNPGYGVPFVNGEPQKQFLPLPAPPPQMQLTPLPGSDLRIPTLGGKRVPGLPMFQQTPLDAPPVGGMGPVRPGTKLTPVADQSAEMPKFQQDKDTGKMFYVVPNDRGGYTRKWVDEDGDGKISAAEQRKATAPNGKPASQFLRAFGA